MDLDDNQVWRDTPRRQLFGRRAGRALGGAMAGLITELMPAYRLELDTPPPVPLTGLFGAPVTDVWLEIGFGGGEHLLWQAGANPHTGYIGCEPFLSGAGKALRGIAEYGLRNVRLYDDDARNVLQWLPGASLGRIFILFPDPWPKRRHRKRRFLSESGLTLIARVLRPGGQLRFATDIADYAGMVSEAIQRRADFREAPGLLAERPPDWPLTRYAQKAAAAGRACQFFVFERV